MNEDKYLTAKEVAKIMDSGVSTITKWCREKRFPNARKIKTPIGEYWEIPESDIIGKAVRMGRPPKD